MRWIAVTLVSIFVVAGCGDDDEGGGGAASGEQLTKAEFIEAGDELCDRFVTETAALDEPMTQDEVVTFLDRAIEIAEQVHDDMAALQPPPDGESVHEALTSALSESTEKVREARDAADEGDAPAAEAAFAEAVEIGQRSDAEAKEYGFEVCGSEAEAGAT
jgi:hypothetical protein